MIKKNKKPCVLLLEDFFAESDAQRLRDAGFLRVERFKDHFVDATRGTVEQSVKDPRLIKFCDQHSWLLITHDSNMQFTHCELIKTTKVAILATAHNSAENSREWVEGLIKAKAQVELKWKKQPLPWCGTFTREGKLRVHTVSPDVVSRRYRPKEM